MSNFTINLKLTPYLAEWFVHEHGGCQPVSLIKNSAESNLIRCFIRQRPVDAKEESDPNVSIYIPTFKTLDVRTYNYLPPRAADALESLIWNNFKVSLWEDLHQFDNAPVEIGELILAYMEKHGISGVRGDTNWESIRQTYYRMRKKYNCTRKNKIVKEGEIPFEK